MGCGGGRERSSTFLLLFMFRIAIGCWWCNGWVVISIPFLDIRCGSWEPFIEPGWSEWEDFGSIMEYDVEEAFWQLSMQSLWAMGKAVSRASEF